MYKILNILPIFCCFVLLASCQSGPSFEKSKDKTEYLNGLKSMSLADLQKSVQHDISYIDSLNDFATNLQLSYSFGMSFSSGDGKTSTEFEEAKPLNFSINRDSLQKDFTEGMQNLYFEQQFIYPNSAISISPEEKSEGGSFTLTPANIYTGNTKVSPQSVGLKRVDSMEVSLSYTFPLDFEKWIISNTAVDTAMWNGEVAVIDRIKGKEADLSMPQVLYKKVLGYQAITSEGKLMDHSSLSAFPATVVKRTVLDEISVTKKMMETAFKSADKESAMKVLSQVPASVFESKTQIQKLKNEIESLDKKENELKARELIKQLKDIIDKYEVILTPDQQTISLKFPADIEKLYIYMGRNYDSLTAHAMAQNQFEISRPYSTYQDSASNKYGIIDSLGTIVVEATYTERLEPVGEGNYFTSYKNGSYYLDAQNKKLTPIEYKTYVSSIDKSRAIFRDTLYYEGVLENNKREILPMIYDEIEAAGKIYKVKKSLRGRSHYEVLNSAGKVIAGNLKDASISEAEDGIITLSKDGKTGLINSEGKYIIQPGEMSLRFLGKGPLLSYTTDGDMYGLMDGNGNKITPEKFYSLDYEGDGLLPARIGNDDLYSYINTNGAVAIAAQYLDAKSFNLGLALVEMKNGFGFINTKGELVKTVPQSAGTFYDIIGSGKDMIYRFEKEKFNAEGNHTNTEEN